MFELATSIYRGMLPLAGDLEVAILGGDTNTWDGPLAISITAIGSSTQNGPLTRSGGRPGDALLATGRFGGSILGRHLQIEPRVREALLLHEKYQLHAGIDVSDGLALDTWRLAEASGTGAESKRCGDLLPPTDRATHPRADEFTRRGFLVICKSGVPAAVGDPVSKAEGRGLRPGGVMKMMSSGGGA